MILKSNNDNIENENLACAIESRDNGRARRDIYKSTVDIRSRVQTV